MRGNAPDRARWHGESNAPGGKDKVVRQGSDKGDANAATRVGSQLGFVCARGGKHARQCALVRTKAARAERGGDAYVRRVHDLDGTVLVGLPRGGSVACTHVSGRATAPINRAWWRDRGSTSDNKGWPGGAGHALAPASLLVCKRAWVHGFA
jgi:hypothetical protein